MKDLETRFHPFFDPELGGKGLNVSSKIGIALAVGILLSGLNYASLVDKQDFFDYYCWALGVILSTSLAALYLAVEVLRHNLQVMNRVVGDKKLSQAVVDNWLTDRAHLIGGSAFGLLTVTVVNSLGIPADLHGSVLSRAVLQLSFFATGFTAGMGLWGILAVIVLYLTFAPLLRFSLDPDNPDGLGGFKVLGDSLWFFGLLIACVGVLVSMYLLSVEWTNSWRAEIRLLFLGWLSLPYLLSISIVLIPGLAVRRQISDFKRQREQQLRQEKARLYASYKQFNPAEDDDIIAQKNEIQDRLNRIQSQMQNLRKMRNSHIDGMRDG